MTLPAITPDTPTPDGELLRRFVADRDEAAFELLVWRHSRLVFEVCRRVLRHRHDAEDATQAAFLVLARKADTVRSAVAGWLAGVAYRCALRLANGRSEPPGGDLVNRGCEPTGDDHLPDLDAELNRLPDRYRLPLVLCCLNGLSYGEAAAELNVKPGTLSGRLSRAKALLRERLLARGVVVPVAAVLLADLPRGSALPPELVRTIVTAAFTPTSSPGRASAVAHGVTRMLTLHTFARRSLAVLAAAVVVLLAGSAAVLLADEPKKPAPADPPKANAKTDQERVQGEWVFDSAESVGGHNAINQAWQSVVTFDGEKLTVMRYQGFDWKTAFKLDPGKSPKQFDMTVSELAKKVMGFKDGTMKGIYRFDGDALEMCLGGTPDDPRPTDFTTGPKLKQFRFTLKKKAKDFDPAKLTEFTVKVVDGDGKPVEGAVVCQNAYGMFDPKSDEPQWTYQPGAVKPLRTDAKGEATFPAEGENNPRLGHLLYARHEKRMLVALEPISPARMMAGVALTLRPEAKLTGMVTLANGGDPDTTAILLGFKSDLWVLYFNDPHGKFDFRLPVGEYHLLARGDYLKEEAAKDYSSVPSLGNTTPVALGPEGKEVKLEAKPTEVAELRGKPATDLGEMAEWKGKAVTLADLKGKVVLLKFFTADENNDIVHSMPRLAELHAEFADKGLVVIGVHSPSAFNEQITTVKQLDKKLEAIRTEHWPKGDIPFPIGLLKPRDAAVLKAYGRPTEPVLIDRGGKVVGYLKTSRDADMERLRKLLDAK